MNYDIKLQLIVMGDSEVGKTSLLYRYQDDKFTKNHLATVGIDYFTKSETINDKKIRIKIWDTAGQERYKAVTVAYYKGSKGAFIVYDVTKKSTFKNVTNWIDDIKKNGEKDTFIILVGNKTDLSQREVTYEEGSKFAEMYSMFYFF